MQQLRKFQGTTDKAAAPKNTAQSVPQLQRTIDGLRERLAHEKRSADAARAASAEHASKLPPLVAERQRLLAAHEELQKACARKDHELRRARALLRESGEAKGGALSEVSHLELARGREQQKFGRELYALKAQLELERNRAAAAEARAARATRAASAGATRSRSAHRLAAGRPGTAAAGEDEEAAAAAAAADEEAAAEAAAAAALPPSAQVRAAMSAAVAEEARRRAAAESALAEAQAQAAALSAEVEAARSDGARLQEQLDAVAGDGAGARSKVRALERQLKGEGDRADRADRARRRAEAQLQQLRAAVCMLTDAHADGTGTLWGGGGDGGGGGGGGGDRLSDETTQRSLVLLEQRLRAAAPPPRPSAASLFATLAGGGGGCDGGDGDGGDSAVATPRSASGSENASPQPLTRAQLKAETLAIARQRIGRAQSADPRVRRPAATRSPAGGASGAALRRRAANRLDRALSMK